MTDVFVSYAHEDKERVKLIVDRLTTIPMSVWWDERLRSGDFSAQIETKIAEAGRVLVAWSAASRGSLWVRGEALEALDQQKLVQVQLDASKLPVPFNAVHAPNLADWRGEPDHAGFATVVEALGGARAAATPRNIVRAGASQSQMTALWLAPTLLALLIAAGAYVQFGPALPAGAPSREALMLAIGGGVAAALIVLTALLAKSALDAFKDG